MRCPAHHGKGSAATCCPSQPHSLPAPKARRGFYPLISPTKRFASHSSFQAAQRKAEHYNKIELFWHKKWLSAPFFKLCASCSRAEKSPSDPSERGKYKAWEAGEPAGWCSTRAAPGWVLCPCTAPPAPGNLQQSDPWRTSWCTAPGRTVLGEAASSRFYCLSLLLLQKVILNQSKFVKLERNQLGLAFFTFFPPKEDLGGKK